MAEKKEFHVKWEIEVWAESPYEAAVEALKIQRDPASAATLFEVAVPGGWRHVDAALTKEEDLEENGSDEELEGEDS